MIDKIVDGSLRKFLLKLLYLNQKFVKDDKKTIKDIIDTGKVNNFLSIILVKVLKKR